MREPLVVKYDRTTKGKSLAIVDRFPGGDAEMDSEELRDLARQCIKIAEILDGMN
jgi:hypothetical protein